MISVEYRFNMDSNEINECLLEHACKDSKQFGIRAMQSSSPEEIYEINEDNIGQLTITSQSNNAPGIPYKQKVIPLPKNLLGNIPYNLALHTDNKPLGISIENIKSTLNNITEILSYLVISQNLRINEKINRNNEKIEEVEDKLEEILNYLREKL